MTTTSTCPVCKAATTERTATGDYTAAYRWCPACEWTSGDQQPPAKTTVDTTEYVRSHTTAPRGRGSWGFTSAEGVEIWAKGTYTEARKTLPGGRWFLLP